VKFPIGGISDMHGEPASGEEVSRTGGRPVPTVKVWMEIEYKRIKT
jgi:hypothetical protein